MKTVFNMSQETKEDVNFKKNENLLKGENELKNKNFNENFETEDKKNKIDSKKEELKTDNYRLNPNIDRDIKGHLQTHEATEKNDSNSLVSNNKYKNDDNAKVTNIKSSYNNDVNTEKKTNSSYNIANLSKPIFQDNKSKF